MAFDPNTATDADIKDFLIQLQRTPKRDLKAAYQRAVGGEEYTVKGVLKETMVRQILGHALNDIGDFEIDGMTMAPNSLVINRFEVPKMDSTQAIREAIEIIRNGIDDDSLVADHAYAQEVITQLQRLPQTMGSTYGTLWGIDDLRIYRPAWSDDTLTAWFSHNGNQLANRQSEDGFETIRELLEWDGMCEGCGEASKQSVCAKCLADYEITRCTECDHVMRRDHIDDDICQVCS